MTASRTIGGEQRRRRRGPDSISARLAQLLTGVAAFAIPGAALSSSTAWTAVVAGAITTVMVLHRRGRPRRTMPTRSDDVAVVAAAVLLGVAGFGLMAAMVGRPASAGSPVVSPWLLLIGGVVGVAALLIVRGIIRQLFNRSDPQRVLVVGVGRDAHEVTGLLLDHPEVNLEFVGVVGDEGTAEHYGLGPTWLGDTPQLEELLHRHRIDAALVTTTGFRSAHFRQVLAVLRDANVEPMLSTGVARLDIGSLRLSSIVHEPMLNIDWNPTRPGFNRVKRVLDVVGALVGLIVVLPIAAVVAIAIKLDDRGPVLYRSSRVGQGGQSFEMFKFRSMRVNAHEEKNDLAQRNERSGPLFKVSNDPRITRVGRVLREASIDELPQLLNVLKGDMSLVGPRPSLPEEADAFDAELSARVNLLPGVTGLWQVEARSNANFSAYRRLDLHYVANQSLVLDLEILVATAVQVIVSVVLLPVAAIRRKSSTDAVNLDAQDASVVDLRERLAQPVPGLDQDVSGL